MKTIKQRMAEGENLSTGVEIAMGHVKWFRLVFNDEGEVRRLIDTGQRVYMTNGVNPDLVKTIGNGRPNDFESVREFYR